MKVTTDKDLATIVEIKAGLSLNGWRRYNCDIYNEEDS